MKAPKHITIVGTHPEVQGEKVKVLNKEQYTAFFHWQFAQAAMNYITYRMTKSVKEGTAETEGKVFASIAEDILATQRKVIELGVFENKYDFDYTWKEI